MIPKIIHYCWFGKGPIPASDLKCIESWKKFCPDYKIIRWDESNYDYKKNRYMREAYEEKKWGFVPDYARLDIVYQNGGIYLDTDVELKKPLDELLKNKAYFGFENDEYVNPGIGFGAEKDNKFLKEYIEKVYGNRVFRNGEGDLNLTPSPILATEFFKRKGLERGSLIQEIDGVVFYPKEYFCPMNYLTGNINLTQNTVSIHQFHASWVPKAEQDETRLKRKLLNKYDEKYSRLLLKIAHPFFRLRYHIETKGFIGAFKFMLKKIKL